MRKLCIADSVDQEARVYWKLELGNMPTREFEHVLPRVVVKLFLAQFVHLRILLDLVLFILDNVHQC